MTFEQVFQERELIRVLSQMRATRAKQRHDAHFHRNISDRAGLPASPNVVDRLFPPRRIWLRLKKEQRATASSAVAVNARSLELTVNRFRNDDAYKDSDWVIRLNEVLSTIRHQALVSRDYKISSPDILLVEKKHPFYRPIATYKLKDRIIVGQCARYLREAFDEDFLDCSFAFRTSHEGRSCPQHHDAVAALRQYRDRIGSDSLWVAECDIEGFFDCVNHRVTTDAFSRAIAKAEGRGIHIDDRAKRFFEAFLRSYSFRSVAIEKAGKWFQRNNKPDGKLKWPKEKLAEFANSTSPENDRIGVPQGGALSCLIANLILDDADRAVLGPLEERDPDLFYARYCDDMILVHPDRAKCESAFNRYLLSLKDLRLPNHEPKAITVYSRDFWESKSKLPYRWAMPDAADAVPWLSFVGYHLRADGLLRIRPSSINKELKKQVEVTDAVLKIVRPKKPSGRRGDSSASEFAKGVKRARGQVLFRLRQRLISMSVGRRELGKNTIEYPSGFCWTAGFRLLASQRVVTSQLKRLDRGRERQIKRIARAIKDLDIVAPSDYKMKNKKQFDGYPFSYYGQFVEPKKRRR